ncbi:MAG: hypothetical protein ACAI34_04865 [Verrucomicrobium sp.]|nr:hypothetical protein [Verrucomicrobium sp.]
MMLYVGLAAAGFLALALARVFTRWVVDRQDDPLFAPIPENERKRDPNAPKREPHRWTVQEQVDNKVYLAAPEFEIREWLETRHKITGAEADAIIKLANSKRAKSIRGQSLFGLIASLIVMAATLVPVMKEFRSGEIVMVKASLLLMGFSLSTVFFCRYLIRVITGKTDEPIKL